MSDTKFTPGPWKAYGHLVYFPKVKGGFSLANCPDREGNANLIAAAPDLYEALEYCIDCLGDEFSLPLDAISDAKAALKKARGE